MLEKMRKIPLTSNSSPTGGWSDGGPPTERQQVESTHFNTPTHHSCDTDAVGGGQEEQDPPTDSQNKCIEIFLNGQKKSIEKNLTLEKLIQNLGLDSKWVVAEVNGQALIKKDYLNLHLSNGDRIELVRAVSGG